MREEGPHYSQLFCRNKAQSWCCPWKEQKCKLDLLEAYCGGMQDSICIVHDKAMAQQELMMVVNPSIDQDEDGSNNSYNYSWSKIHSRMHNKLNKNTFLHQYFLEQINMHKT